MDIKIIDTDNIKDFIPSRLSPKIEKSNKQQIQSQNNNQSTNQTYYNKIRYNQIKYTNIPNNNYCNYNIIYSINDNKCNKDGFNLLLNNIYNTYNNKINYNVYNNIKCDISINNLEQIKYLSSKSLSYSSLKFPNCIFLLNKINNYTEIYSLEIQRVLLNKIEFNNIKNIITFTYKIMENNLINCDNLKRISFNNMTDLKYIDINNTKIKYLIINNCNSLKIININNNQIKYLLINNCPNLEKIICSYNQIMDLNIINCNNIKCIDCSNNLLCSKSLKTIDLCKYKQLKYFNSLNNYILNINLNKETYNNRYKEFYYDNFTKINLCKLH